MSEKAKFSRNYHDLSTDTGYQFEFFCDHCGKGFRSGFQGPFTGRASHILNATNQIFGGVLGTMSTVAHPGRDATWERAHDKAFLEAVEELSSSFIQCPLCQKWVCRENCWNLKKGLCTDCAPDSGSESEKREKV